MNWKVMPQFMDAIVMAATFAAPAEIMAAIEQMFYV